MEDLQEEAADKQAERELSPAEMQAQLDEEEAREFYNQVDTDDVVIAEAIHDPVPTEDAGAALKAVIEGAIYITDEPLTAEQIASATDQSLERVKEILANLVAEYSAADRGLSIREIAGGYKMATKPEYHESIRRFVKKLQPPLKLSLAALETLAVVAYKQPITAPEIMDIRGVQGAGVLKTLLDRKLVAAAGRKDVIGKPILYKTTREFLIQFGLNSLAELPTLKEFEELGRLALSESESEPARSEAPAIDAEPETAPIEAWAKTRIPPSQAGTMPEERLQKILAHAGVTSRRKAEELIMAGRVSVNGKTITELGSKADPAVDKVKVDGRVLTEPKHHLYLAFHKPKNCVTTVHDPEGRQTVMSFFKGMKERIYPVGRLDYASEGLLLLTNDGELANKLISPASHVTKTYLAKVKGQLTAEQEEEFRQGIPMHGKRTAPAGLKLIKKGENPWYEVRLVEGRQNQIRIMFKHFGHLVEKLKRVKIGFLELGVLKPGAYRTLTNTEVSRFRKLVNLTGPAAEKEKNRG